MQRGQIQQRAGGSRQGYTGSYNQSVTGQEEGRGEMIRNYRHMAFLMECILTDVHSYSATHS